MCAHLRDAKDTSARVEDNSFNSVEGEEDAVSRTRRHVVTEVVGRKGDGVGCEEEEVCTDGKRKIAVCR
jgi:hypothetical protein